MTTFQMLSFFIMPVGGLLIGFAALYLTRNWGGQSHPGK